MVAVLVSGIHSGELYFDNEAVSKELKLKFRGVGLTGKEVVWY